MSNNEEGRLSDEQRRSIAALTGIKQWYVNVGVAPTRELSKLEAISSLDAFRKDIMDIQEDEGLAKSDLVNKAYAADEILGIMYSLLHNEDDEDDADAAEQQRYFSYDLDGKSVGLALTTQKERNTEKIHINVIASHPGVKMAASAILEEIVRSAGNKPEVTLKSYHGSMAVYRRLGFIPENETIFTSKNIAQYDSKFLNITEDEALQLPDEDFERYRSYLNMCLRPHQSDLWEIKSGRWHYKPDGNTYLGNAQTSTPYGARSA
jgi:hypothetical protein